MPANAGRLEDTTRYLTLGSAGAQLRAPNSLHAPVNELMCVKASIKYHTGGLAMAGAGILVTRSEVFVPISLLETAELTASEKLVGAGLALDADEKGQPRSPEVRLAES